MSRIVALHAEFYDEYTVSGFIKYLSGLSRLPCTALFAPLWKWLENSALPWCFNLIFIRDKSRNFFRYIG